MSEEVEHIAVWWCPVHQWAGHPGVCSDTNCNTILQEIGWIEEMSNDELFDDGSNDE